MTAVPTIARTVADLTPAWLTAAMHRTLDGARVTAVATEPVGTGQLGSVTRAVLSYDRDAAALPASVIVKLASQDPVARGTGMAMGVYVCEVRFYQEVAERVDVRVPAVHVAELDAQTGWFTLVCEDLTAVAAPGDVLAGGTADQAALALTELTRLQAPLWNDAELRRRRWISDKGIRRLFGSFPDTVAAFERRFADTLRPEHLALATRVLPRALDWIDGAWPGPQAVQHGDYRLDNLLFGVRPGAPPVVVVDWQATRLGPPLLDVGYYLGSSLSVADRRAHEEQLVRDYHAGLLARGVVGFDWDACWTDYRRTAMYGLLLGAGMSVKVAQTPRGDRMFAAAIAAYADLVLDLDAERLLGP